MKNSILLFSLVFSTFANAQNFSGEALPFEDYQTCLMGMKNSQHEVIYEPQFSEFKRVLQSNVRFWIVQKDEHYGLLSNSGNPLLPFQFENIEHLHDSLFILTENGTSHVSDLKGKSYSDKYESISHIKHQYDYKNWEYSQKSPLNPNYTYSVNGKYGVLNHLFEPITKPLFASIKLSFFSISISDGTHRKHLLDTAFVVMNDEELTGYLHLDGTEWIHCKYASIEPINSYELDQTKSNYFLIMDSLGMLGLCDSTGNEVIPTVFDDLIPNSKIMFDGDHLNFTSFIGENQQGFTLFSISGKRLGPFEGAISFGQNSIIKEKKTWSVVDKDLNYLVSGLKGLPSIHQREFQGFDDNPYYKDHRNIYDWDSYKLDPDFNVVFQCEPHQFKKNKKSNRNKKGSHSLSAYGKRGLVDLKTGKTIPPKYQEFSIRQDSLETYFWGYYDYSSETNNQKVDIYDGKLSLVRTLELNRSQRRYTANRKYLGPNSRVYFTYKDGKLGALDCSGKTVIPFEFADHVPRSVPTTPYEFDGISSYMMQKGHRNDSDEPYSDVRFGLYSPLGEEMFKPEYNEIGISAGREWVLNKNGNYTVLDLDYTVRMNNCSFVTVGNWFNYAGIRVPKRHSEREPVVNFAIRNDSLYAFLPDTIVLMNADVYPFQAPVNRFLSRILMNKSGRVISITEGNLLSFRSKKGFCFQSDSSLTILDEFGNVLEKVPKVLYFAEQTNNELNVGFHDGKTALFNTRSLRWILRPDYPCLIQTMPPSSSYNETRYWIRELDSVSHLYNWHLIDSNGTDLLDFTLDFPVFDFNSVVCRNDKFGVLNNDLTMKIPFDYDFIQAYDDQYLCVKDGLWGLYSHSQLMTPQFTEISTQAKKGKRFVFIDEKIGLLDEKNNYVIHPMHCDSLINQYDLQKMLEITAHENRGFGFGAIEMINGIDDVYRKISNRNILNYYTLVSSENIILERTGSHKKFYVGTSPAYYNRAHKTEQRMEWREIQFAKNGFYSEIHNEIKYIWKFNRKHQQNRGKLKVNYRIENGKLVPVSVGDLFAKNVAVDEILKRLITDELTKYQVFGLACINSEALFNAMKRNFSILPSGLSFSYMDGKTEKSILLSPKNLKPYLNDQKMFD